MEKTQTAVEWLVKKLSEILGPLETKPMQDLLMVDAINKAKQMEKQQIINSYKQGQIDSSPIRETDGEQYFNLIFKNK